MDNTESIHLVEGIHWGALAEAGKRKLGEHARVAREETYLLAVGRHRTGVLVVWPSGQLPRVHLVHEHLNYILSRRIPFVVLGVGATELGRETAMIT